MKNEKNEGMNYLLLAYCHVAPTIYLATTTIICRIEKNPQPHVDFL